MPDAYSERYPNDISQVRLLLRDILDQGSTGLRSIAHHNVAIVSVCSVRRVTHPGTLVSFCDGDKVHDGHRSHLAKQGDHETSSENSQ